MIQFMSGHIVLVIGLFVIIVAAVSAIVLFVKLPSTSQVDAMKEWLKYAVTIAEKELGSGTGQLKLRMVYQLFVEKFAWLAKFIPFETFSGYVDEALAWMKEQLSNNQAVASLVSGGNSGKSETASSTDSKAEITAVNMESEVD